MLALFGHVKNLPNIDKISLNTIKYKHMSSSPAPNPPEPQAPSDSTWSRLGMKNLMLDFSTPAEVENARFESLQQEARNDPAEILSRRTRLEELRTEDVDPAIDNFIATGEMHLLQLEALLAALRQLRNAANAHNQRMFPPVNGSTPPEIIENTFWSTVQPELDGLTGTQFVQTRINPNRSHLSHMLADDLWVRGSDSSVHDSLDNTASEFTANFTTTQVICTLPDLRTLIDGTVAPIPKAMRSALRAARTPRDNARHTAAGGTGDEYVAWRGTEDRRRGEWTGIVGDLTTIENRDFWQLQHEENQPTIATRARNLAKLIRSSVLGNTGGTVTVEHLKDISDQLDALRKDMEAAINNGKADHVRVAKGTADYERGLMWGSLRGLFLSGAGATVLGFVTYFGVQAYNATSPSKPGVTISADGKRIDAQAGAENVKITDECSVSVKGTTIYVQLPDDIKPDNIETRFVLWVSKSEKEEHRFVALKKTAKGWEGTLNDDEAEQASLVFDVWDDRNPEKQLRSRPEKAVVRVNK